MGRQGKSLFSRPLRKAERQWALERSAGHCWFCGCMLPVGTRAFGGISGFIATKLQQDKPPFYDNIVAACFSCGTTHHKCAWTTTAVRHGVVAAHRFLVMRKQFAPMLTEHEVEVARQHGGAVRFRLHHFWFETDAGRQVIEAVERRRLTG